MVKMYMDDRKVEAREGENVLDVARRVGVPIPTLCHNEALEPSGACRLCVVEVTLPGWDGWRKLVTSCLYPVTEELRVFTMSERVVKTRALVLDLLLARCPDAKLIQELAAEHGIKTTTFVPREDPDDCILCGLCTRACDKVGAHAITTAQRGHLKVIATPFDEPPEDCIGCGACAEICPTQCIELREADGVRHIWERDFELLRCASCGAPHMTAAERDHLVKLRGLDASFYAECPSCKRQRVGESMADVVLRTHPDFVPKQMGGEPLPPLPRVARKEVSP